MQSDKGLAHKCYIPKINQTKGRSWVPLLNREDGELGQERRCRGDPASEGGDTGPPYSRRSVGEDNRGTAFVDLKKKEGCGLGLVVSGGIDKDQKPRISYLRPGGIAQRCDQLEVGDYIVSVNGIRTAMLMHDEIVSLLKNADDNVVLEVEYELPTHPQNTFSVICKRIEIALEKEGPGGNYGFTLRGGMSTDATKCRPLTITQIRPGSSADRNGIMKVGDRVLAINGHNVSQCTLDDALKVLKRVDKQSVLLMEYDVSVMDAVQNACGPLLVEIDKTPGSSLGITLTSTQHKAKSVICIESIKPASIADRCGALHVGDHVLGIDDASLEHMSLAEGKQLLKCAAAEHIKLEILPITQLKSRSTSAASTLNRPQQTNKGPAPLTKQNVQQNSAQNSAQNTAYNSYTSLQSYTTNNSMQTQMGSAIHPNLPLTSTLSRGSAGSRSGWGMRQRKFSNIHEESASLGSSGTYSGVMLPGNQVCHTETTEVVLVADHRGFGIQLGSHGYPGDVLLDPPFISFMEPKSVAERCGVVQVGDRVLSINGQFLENKSLDMANHMIQNKGHKLVILTEFDVAESIIPSSGVFNVKVAKRGVGLGITISSPRDRKPGDPLHIADVKKGSVAHRTGTIHPGDKLLAIDTYRMDNCSIEDAATILQESGDIVRLKIQKDEQPSPEEEPISTVTYTVELQRHGGPLGVTISGTEEPFDPIFISGLTEGGLAERTGALHIGDRILAINGQTLRGKPLSDAIEMLQVAGDTVTLKITRPTRNPPPPHNMSQIYGARGGAGKSQDVSVQPLPLQSVDSALESWDSSGLDSNGAKGGTKPKSKDHRDGVASSNSSASGEHVEPSVSSLATMIERQPKKSTDTKSYDDLSDKIKIRGDKPPNSTTQRSDSPQDLPPDPNMIDTDEWSKKLDELDHLGPLSQHSDRFSPFSQSDLGVGSMVDEQCSPATSQASTSGINQSMCNSDYFPPPPPPIVQTAETSFTDSNGGSIDIPSRHYRAPSLEYDDHSGRFSSSCSKLVHGADLHLQEVEEQLHAIFTPTPVELYKVTLIKLNHAEDFGFSLSDGVYEKGVYISAIRPGGPADRSGVLKPYDKVLQINHINTASLGCQHVAPLIARAGGRIDVTVARKTGSEENLEMRFQQERVQQQQQQYSRTVPSTFKVGQYFDYVNGIKTKELECHQVVPLIAQSGQTIDLITSRNPIASDMVDDDNASSLWESASVGCVETKTV